MNADGSNLFNVTNDATVDLFPPTWSPDGTKIAFVRVIDLTNCFAGVGVFTGNYELFIMNADGSGQTNLTKSPSIEADPAWSSTFVRQ